MRVKVKGAGWGSRGSIRTLERAGKTHAAISAEVICEAACRVVGCVQLHRVPALVFAFGLVDLLLGALFVASFWKTVRALLAARH
jgi:hypothetical protein